ncbi:4Fe-4S binding protein [Desulforamulus aquiferis]|uniref:4Fe-4S binding protein n=1 Tax=Desulforamulus aquiferis TaxID=1397668 RepID=A0AAW7ZAM7_9FIRM|nr:4Fe-4S binding protein [Desulforamulus aquiferis]MDO7786417.1 4Fe-4S binding protein [Desulforamulus aquiferis]RYD02516.1 2-oxoacid:acceptor oxidoreductase subunit delta [Desulforamulus aquiferis]
MSTVTFREERCKGCELCIIVCPEKIITLADHFNAMGFHPATVTEMDKCKGCAMCARMCPDVVIEVMKEEKQA